MNNHRFGGYAKLGFLAALLVSMNVGLATVHATTESTTTADVVTTTSSLTTEVPTVTLAAEVESPSSTDTENGTVLTDETSPAAGTELSSEEPASSENQPTTTGTETTVSGSVSSQTATEEPYSHESNALINVPTVWEAGNKGEGMVVAIVDSGIDVEHDAFRLTDPEKAKYKTEADFNAVKEAAGINYGQWQNEKIVFVYNYLDTNTEVKENKEASHGAHVAGIAAGNPSQEDSSGSKIVGVAPEVQLMFMRVFSDNFGGGSGTQPFLYIRAIEDAVKLGADVINLSLGSAAGSLIDASVALNQAIEDAKKKGVSVVIAAGNDTAWGEGQGKPLVANPDYGLVASPAAAKDSIAVASFNNSHVTKEVFQVLGMENKPEFDNGQGTFTKPSGLAQDFVAGKEYEYVFVGLGKPEDFTGKTLTGKIALIQRGAISFNDKIATAKKNGAVGAVIFNNVETGNDLSMAVTTRDARAIPSIFIPMKLGKELAAQSDAGIYKLVFDKKTALLPNPEANQMSDFTSWGLTADGELKPDVTAPGGAIYSSINNGKYASMNGTSMASPHVAGAVALVKKALLEKYPDLSPEQLQERIKQVLMSTARPHFDQASNAYVSPRQQGAGLIDVPAAIASSLYVTGLENYPSISLGNVQDQFDVTVVLTNTSDKEQTVRYLTHLNTDEVKDGRFSLKPRQLAQVEGETISLAANSSKTITIRLDASSFASELTSLMPNGYYLEGFVRFLDAVEGIDLVSIPFVGFRGQFQNLAVLEKSIYDFTGQETPFYTENGFSADGSLTLDERNFYTALVSSKAEFNHETGEHGVQSPLVLGTFDDGNGNFLIKRDEQGRPILALSPNGDGNRDALMFRGVFLRNFRNLTATVYKADDTERSNPLWISEPISGGKNFYAGRESNPRAHLLETTIWEAKDANGKDVPDGTYHYVISYLPTTAGSQLQTMEFTIQVSRVRPAITTGILDVDNMTFKPRSPIAYGMPLYRQRVYYIIPTKDENGNPIELEDPNNIGPSGRPLKEVLTQAKRIYVPVDENGVYTLPSKDILGRDLDVSSFFYAVEDLAGNVLSANLAEFADLPSDHGIVVVQVINDQTGEEHPTGYNYLIRDADGNVIAELVKPGGPLSNLQLLPFGTYTVELHLLDKDVSRLVDGEPTIKTFTVSEENSLLGVSFRVTPLVRYPVMADFGGLAPEGTKIFLINQYGEEIELTRARYAPEVFERLINQGTYTIRVEVPAGYQALDLPQTYEVEKAVRNLLNLTLISKVEALTTEAPPAFDLAADADGDGFSNQEELLAGTDYTDPTSVPLVTAKGEGVTAVAPPVGHIDLKGSSVTAPVLPVFDLSADADGDGFSNQAELLAGTDYTNAASLPQATVKGESVNTAVSAPTDKVASPAPILSLVTGERVAAAEIATASSNQLPHTGSIEDSMAYLGAIILVSLSGLLLVKKKEAA